MAMSLNCLSLLKKRLTRLRCRYTKKLKKDEAFRVFLAGMLAQTSARAPDRMALLSCARPARRVEPACWSLRSAAAFPSPPAPASERAGSDDLRRQRGLGFWCSDRRGHVPCHPLFLRCTMLVHPDAGTVDHPRILQARCRVRRTKAAWNGPHCRVPQICARKPSCEQGHELKNVLPLTAER